MDFSGLWKKSAPERCALVGYAPPVDACSEGERIPQIENYTGFCTKVPIGLVPGCTVNGKTYTVTLSTEEASVVAANCKANKIIKAYSQPSGFTASVRNSRNIAEGQIFIQHSVDEAIIDEEGIEECIELLKLNKEFIIEKANTFCPSMVNRGGGVIDLKVRQVRLAAKQLAVVLHAVVDVCESMGANCVNTVVEGLADVIDSLLSGRMMTMYKIVSNYSSERAVEASFKMSIQKWGMENLPAAKRIVKLNEWAKVDQFRCITHNKGIFNGIEALALATGQDTRAIEAAGHLHATMKGAVKIMNRNDIFCCSNGDRKFMQNGGHNVHLPDIVNEARDSELLTNQQVSYQPLTEYWIEDDEYLCGTISIPLLTGIKGGSLHCNQLAEYNINFMQIESSQELAMLMASIGLAQNFAALLAIATDGIQKGHMTLHKRNIAA